MENTTSSFELKNIFLRKTRLIARLDIKGLNLIKGVHLEGLRVIGDPSEYSLKYYEEGIDELLYMDCVASLYGRNHLTEIIKKAARNIFVPITVGGGIRSEANAEEILRSGADKVAINTAACKNPNLIRRIAERFGSQAMVLSVEAKKVNQNKWEAFTENGRERTGRDVIEWVKEATDLGAGEILLTSVDREGTRKGFDLELIKAVCALVSVPVIVSGGMGKPRDLVAAVLEGGADAVAMADILHHNRASLRDIRAAAQEALIEVRRYS